MWEIAFNPSIQYNAQKVGLNMDYLNFLETTKQHMITAMQSLN